MVTRRTTTLFGRKRQPPSGLVTTLPHSPPTLQRPHCCSQGSCLVATSARPARFGWRNSRSHHKIQKHTHRRNSGFMADRVAGLQPGLQSIPQRTSQHPRIFSKLSRTLGLFPHAKSSLPHRTHLPRPLPRHEPRWHHSRHRSRR